MLGLNDNISNKVLENKNCTHKIESIDQLSDKDPFITL